MTVLVFSLLSVFDICLLSCNNSYKVKTLSTILLTVSGIPSYQFSKDCFKKLYFKVGDKSCTTY